MAAVLAGIERRDCLPQVQPSDVALGEFATSSTAQRPRSSNRWLDSGCHLARTSLRIRSGFQEPFLDTAFLFRVQVDIKRSHDGFLSLG